MYGLSDLAVKSWHGCRLYHYSPTGDTLDSRMDIQQGYGRVSLICGHISGKI